MISDFHKLMLAIAEFTSLGGKLEFRAPTWQPGYAEDPLNFMPAIYCTFTTPDGKNWEACQEMAPAFKTEGNATSYTNYVESMTKRLKQKTLLATAATEPTQ